MEIPSSMAGSLSIQGGTPSLSIRGLTKIYRTRRSFFSAKDVEVRALRAVDLELTGGATLAITGPSGSGKSTLARCIAGLEEPTSGEIWFGGDDLLRAEVAHRRVQLVFQDAGASLNPRFSVEEALREPRPDVNVAEALEQVGLPATLAARLTSQLSGGQKARLALARALAALDPNGGPAILILDESLGSLDLSVRAQIMNLLVDLQAGRGLTYIFITHDMKLAEHIADKIAVLNAGEVSWREARIF